LSGPSLKYAGADVVAGEFGAWAPIGAEQTTSGYEVAWKMTGADQYTVWNTDSSGNYISNIGAVSGTSASLESHYKVFNLGYISGTPSAFEQLVRHRLIRAQAARAATKFRLERFNMTLASPSGLFNRLGSKIPLPARTITVDTITAIPATCGVGLIPTLIARDPLSGS